MGALGFTFLGGKKMVQQLVRLAEARKAVPISHRSPSQLGRHKHLKESMPSTQVAPFRQGLEWHSSVSARNQGLPLGRTAPPTGELVSLLVQEGTSVGFGEPGSCKGLILKHTATAAAGRMKARDPAHLTTKTLVCSHLTAEHHSEDSTSSTRCIQDTVLSCGNSSLSAVCLMHQTCKILAVSPPAMGLRRRTWNSYK